MQNQIQLSPADELPPGVLDSIRLRLSFSNPAYLENIRLGYSNYQTPEMIRGYRIKENSMIIPRGFFPSLVWQLKQGDVSYRVDDRRRLLAPVDFAFHGTLKDFQVKPVEDILAKDSGVCMAPTGSGKTVIAISVIAARRQPTLIVVHTKELMDQWIARIEEFLGIPEKEIGQIGGGHYRTGQRITVALVQSLYRCSEDVTPYVGHLIVDECHRTPSRTFTEAVGAFDARYLLGLSATPFRRDRLTKLIYWALGNRVCEIEQSALIEAGHILQADVEIRKTDFFTMLDPQKQYSSMLTELAADHDRNCLIVSDVAREASNGSGICLVLSDRKEHCQTLADLMEAQGTKAEVLTGDLRLPERRRIVEDLNNGRIKVLVATGQLIGEGFDCKALSTLFLAMPISFQGRLIQYLGRVMRPAPGKTSARVIDYVDENIGVLANSGRSRQRLYSRSGRAEVSA